MSLFSSSPVDAANRSGGCAEPEMEPIAPRILYSADAAALIAPVDLDETAQANWVQASDNGGQAEQEQQPAALVVIDDSIEDIDTLQSFLAAEQRRGLEIDWLLVNQETDGIDAVANALDSADKQYDSIHVFSHGSDAELRLGAAVVNQDTFESHTDTFAQWQFGLKRDADILLYACDFSASEQGKALAQNLAATTAADVASSSNTTGHTDLGGDWVLEEGTGAIEAPVLVSPQLGANWLSSLATTPAATEISVPADTSQNDRLPNMVGGRQVATNGTMTVAVWERSNEVFFRRFQIDGTPLDVSDQQIENLLGKKNDNPTVAMASNGDFAIAWVSFDGSSGAGINAQMFNADGTSKPRPADAYADPYSNAHEFRVNETTTGNQVLPAIAVRPDDTFVISWSGPFTVPVLGTSEGVAYTLHNLDGTFIRTEFIASSNNSTDEVNPAVASHPIDGTMVIVYERNPPGESTLQIRRLQANGNWVVPVVDLAETGRDLSNPSVAIAPNGNTYITATADENDILMWVYAPDNTLISGSSVQVNEISGGRLRNAQVSVQENNSVIVVWETDQGPQNDEVSIRQFDGLGNPIGPESYVNSVTAGHQHQPSLAISGNNGLVLWSGDRATDNDGVFLRQMTITPPGVRVTPTGTTTTEAGGTVTLAIRLETQPAGSVNVAIATSDSTEGVPSITALAFDAADWDTEKIVVVSGQDDLLADGDVAYDITVSASSSDPIYGALTDTIVALSNTDDEIPPTAPVGPITDIDPDPSSVLENAAAGTSVGITAFAEDPDPGDNVSYAITGPSATFFDIGLTTGVVTTSATPLDYESSTSHLIRVVATSDDSSTSFQDFTIAVLDVDENPPVVTSGQAFSVAENSSNGSVVGTPLATDLSGTTVFQDWTITGGTGAAVFDIDPVSGQMTVVDQSALDFEATPSLTLSLTVSDGTNTSAVETITINLTNVNEAPLGANATSGGTEDNDITLTSAEFVLNDPDAGDALFGIELRTLPGAGTLLLNGTALGSSATLPQVLTTAALDNGDLVYRPPADVNGSNVDSFDIAVIDLAGERSITRTQSIDLAAVDDPPIISSYGGAPAVTIDVAENTSIVGAVNAADAESELMQYAGTGLDAAFFDVDPNTGAVQFLVAPDFETALDNNGDNRYEITVVASDPAGNTDSQALTVKVTNQNDVAPVITAGQTFTVAENAVNGTPVNTPTVTDADGPGTYTNWAIVGGAGSGTFSIDATSGLISVSNASGLDFESANTLDLLVSVSDGTNTSAAETVTIALNNVNEPPQSSNGVTNATEDTDYVFTLSDFSFTDPDVGDELSAVVITGLPGNGALLLNGMAISDSASLPITVSRGELLAGALVYRPEPNAAGAGIATFTFKVTDSGGAESAPATQTLNVAAVNDLPSIGGSQRATISIGNTLTLSPTILSATDADDAADSIIYTIAANPSQGVLLIDERPMSQGDRFSQADINSGRVRYQSEATAETVDSISLRVTDSQDIVVGDVTVSITALGSPMPAPVPDDRRAAPPPTQSDPTDTANDESDATDEDEPLRSSTVLVSPPALYNPPANGSADVITSLSGDEDEGYLQAVTSRAQREQLTTGRWLLSGHYGSDLARSLGGSELEIFGLSSEFNRPAPDRLAGPMLLSDFERMRDVLGDDFARQLQFDKTVVASSVAVSTSLSIGYVLWLLRSGALLSSVLASIPAWRVIDPLPILASMPNRDDTPKDKSLEQMVNETEAAADQTIETDSKTKTVKPAAP